MLCRCNTSIWLGDSGLGCTSWRSAVSHGRFVIRADGRLDDTHSWVGWRRTVGRVCWLTDAPAGRGQSARAQNCQSADWNRQRALWSPLENLDSAHWHKPQCVTTAEIARGVLATHNLVTKADRRNCDGNTVASNTVKECDPKTLLKRIWHRWLWATTCS